MAQGSNNIRKEQKPGFVSKDHYIPEQDQCLPKTSSLRILWKKSDFVCSLFKFYLFSYYLRLKAPHQNRRLYFIELYWWRLIKEKLIK